MRGNLFLVCFSFLLYWGPANVWAMEGSYNEDTTLENKGISRLQTPPNTSEPDSKEKEEKKVLQKRNVQSEKIPDRIAQMYLEVIHQKSSIEHKTYEKVICLIKKAPNIKYYNEIFSTFYECAANNAISSRGFGYIVDGAYTIAYQNYANSLEIMQDFLYIMERLPSRHSQYAYYLSKNFADIKEANSLEFKYASNVLSSLCDHIKSSEYIPSLFINMMKCILKIYKKKCDFQKEYEEIQQIIKDHHSICSQLNERAMKIDELVPGVEGESDIAASERFLAIIEKIPYDYIKYADLLVKILEETKDKSMQNLAFANGVQEKNGHIEKNIIDEGKVYRFHILRKLSELRNKENISSDIYAQVISDIGKALEGIDDSKKRYEGVKLIVDKLPGKKITKPS